MIQEFDHVGLVVKNTEETAKTLMSLFGFKITEQETFEAQGFKSTLISKGKVTIELIEPLGDKGIIQNHIRKNGYGLHHISLRVDDIENEMSSLKEKGARLLNESPERITAETRIAFIHPHSAGGVLVELMERIP